MNKLFGVVLSVIIAILMSCFGSVGQAEARGFGGSFSGSTEYSVGSDLLSGWTNAYVYGANAVTTRVSSYVSFHIHNDGFAHANVHFHFSGVWGDPAVDSPLYDILEDQGMSSSASFYSSTIEFNGDYYEFETSIGLGGYSNAGLWRYSEDGVTTMEGTFSANSYGVGMIPTYASVDINEYASGHPEEFPDWEVNVTSNWLVTTPFRRVVPAPGIPGTAGLVCLAGLCFRRRRSPHCVA